MELQVVYCGPDAEQLFGVYAQAFVDRFGSRQPLQTPLDGFTGRVLRGRTDADFLTLTDDPRRRVVFLTDAAALCTLVGSHGREILAQIGYAETFIARLVEQRTRFKLALFPDVVKRLATWDNLLDLASEAYPAWHTKIACARPALKETCYEQLQGEAAEVRAFLEDVLNVNRLFAGDGYTRREDDPLRRVHPEYVILNRPLAEMEACCLIDFPVDAAHGETK
jgi:hypothetical protein